MELEIDDDLLRHDLIEYLGTAMQYNPAAVVDLAEVENASFGELINIALRFGFDLKEYDVNKGRTF